MFNLKKTVTLTIAGLAAIGCVSIGASALNSLDANSGSVAIDATNQGQLTTNHEYVGGGEWWWGINVAGWASSDYMHRELVHGASVKGSWFADSGWIGANHMASAGCMRNLAGTTYINWRTQ